ncbi:MAG TPA: hypothetical protein VHH36_05205 [Candidatus Thermoplasmatota archaeon]|nr:hypothetical protein [Candidatus Thermoplasmatota archaeon]
MKVPPWGWVAAAALATAILLAGVAGWVGRSTPTALGSNSMSHAREALPGVLDPGEAITLAPIGAREDVVTYYEGRRTGHRVGDDWGDMVAYHPDPDVRTVRFVHRAVAWVVYNATSDAYDVPEIGVFGQRAFHLPEVGLFSPSRDAYVHRALAVELDPATAGRHDGFLTKGDFNEVVDQDARAVGAPGEEVARGLSERERAALFRHPPLVQPAHVAGRVIAITEGSEATVVFWVAAGGAALVAVGAVVAIPAWRRRGRRAGRLCGACGRPRRDDLPFCAACGADR